MKIRVKFFAAPREALNRGEIEQELQPGATVRELLAHLRQEYPALCAYTDSVRIAVNHKYAAADAELHEGDEVACLPPVGGG